MGEDCFGQKQQQVLSCGRGTPGMAQVELGQFAWRGGRRSNWQGERSPREW